MNPQHEDLARLQRGTGILFCQASSLRQLPRNRS